MKNPDDPISAPTFTLNISEWRSDPVPDAGGYAEGSNNHEGNYEEPHSPMEMRHVSQATVHRARAEGNNVNASGIGPLQDV